MDHPLELRIEALSKTYPNGVQALRDVPLTVPAGMFGLLGPNGAGKSPLLRTLTTLQAPDRGSIRLGAHNTQHKPEAQHQTHNKLPQEFGVYRDASAESLLDY